MEAVQTLSLAGGASTMSCFRKLSHGSRKLSSSLPPSLPPSLATWLWYHFKQCNDIWNNGNSTATALKKDSKVSVALPVIGKLFCSVEKACMALRT
jgi:hypothetical protein